MNKLIPITLIVSSITLSGCLNFAHMPNINHQPHKYSFPDKNIKTTQYVGNEIIAWGEYIIENHAYIEDELPKKVWPSPSKAQNIISLVEYSSSKGKFYCNEDVYNLFCLSDSNSSGYFDKAHHITAMGLNSGRNIEPVKYQLRTVEASNSTSNNNFKYELIYLGVNENTIRLAYREYKSDMARSAFTQDLTYNLNKSGDTSINFRNAEIAIHSADNNKIKYTVLKGFQDK